MMSEDIHAAIAADVNESREARGYAVGYVMCRHCGRMQRQGMADGLRNGWPKCCGYTMTIDVPLDAVKNDSTPRKTVTGETDG
jgi:hypothetical protein